MGTNKIPTNSMGMKHKLNKHGYIYTLAIALLILPLLFLIFYYSTTLQPKTDDTVGRVRCDELYYFVQDINKDLQRAVVIFGRRAAIYAIDDVVTTGKPLNNYTFTCTPACNVDCTKLTTPTNGSEAAIAELTLCGTLRGQNVTYMMNHTLSQWLSRINNEGNTMRFRFNITITNITVIPHDAFSFTTLITHDTEIDDETGLCHYLAKDVTGESITTIIGLEDPLYPLNTESRVIKYISNCTPNYDLSTVAGCSILDYGEGVGWGDVKFLSQIENETTNKERETYCTDREDAVNRLVVFMDTAFGNCNTFEQNCFNISYPYHFAAAGEYAKNNPDSSFVKKCEVTIPWISATCKLDNDTKWGPGAGCDRPPECDDALIKTAQCVLVNNEACGNYTHQVAIGLAADEVNVSCYQPSNPTSYNTTCNAYPGPSFFDRLDGRYNLSELYAQQSQDAYNTTLIGLETLVSPYEIDDHSIQVHEDATWIDYLYWQDVKGCAVVGSCSSNLYPFILDCAHAHVLGLSTECETIPCNASTTTTTTTTTSTTTTTIPTTTSIPPTTTTTTTTMPSSTTTTTTTTTVPCTGFSDDMEHAEGPWTHGGTQDEWELGSTTWGSCNSGSNCWGTDLDTSYNNNANQWLQTGAIDLTNANNPTLTFYRKNRLKSGDNGYLEIQTTGSGTWTTLDTYNLNQNSWTQNTYNLNAYKGSQIRIRFSLTSDGSNTDRGLYVDDFNVSCG
ncbi:Immune inhibitor A peptidase M6 [uncultured archaeon]|nr:Immune inhibitor A peptidase M6 [uncultured archaeon]